MEESQAHTNTIEQAAPNEHDMCYKYYYHQPIHKHIANMANVKNSTKHDEETHNIYARAIYTFQIDDFDSSLVRLRRVHS